MPTSTPRRTWFRVGLTGALLEGHGIAGRGRLVGVSKGRLFSADNLSGGMPGLYACQLGITWLDRIQEALQSCLFPPI